jgi:multiple sugar transport system permease protein
MAVTVPTVRRPWISPMTVRNTLLGLAFCSPWLVGLFGFRAYPIIMAFWYSLTDYQGMEAPQFIGLTNYVQLFNDYELANASMNTIIYTAMAIPAATSPPSASP